MRIGLAIATIFFLALAACGGSSAPSAGAPSSAAAALARAQDVVDRAAGYRVEVSGHNLVLPQWGGVDAATLDIGRGGSIAQGTLDRTGDGQYALTFRDGQTFFKRSTCDHFARVPGGGPDVLRPFLWGQTGALSKAGNAAYGFRPPDSPTLLVIADIADLGPVAIELDRSTHQPLRLLVPPQPNGSESTWIFSGWDNAPEVPLPSGPLPDQGPGGNPC